MTTDAGVDAYIKASGSWPDEMVALRPILLDGGLNESIKWNKPCYGFDGANVAIVQEMKGFLSLLFVKGALLDDPDGLLQTQGPNTRSAMRICFTSVDEVMSRSSAIAALVRSAIDVEVAGLELEPAPALELVEELRDRLERRPDLKAAFEALTPGRRREYHLHISSAKQAKTRESRVDTCTERILAGKGLRDR